MRTRCIGTFKVLLIFIVVTGAVRVSACEKPVGRVVSLQGVVETRLADQTNWQAAKLNDSLCAGDSLRTAAHSRSALVLANETLVRLDQLSNLTLSGLDEPSPWVDLVRGIGHFISRTPRALKIKTPYVNAGIEGTEFVVQSDANAKQGSITVIEGRVLAENAQGSLRLTSGESASSAAGKAPSKRLLLHPRDAVQWSLYYPPLYDARALAGSESWAEATRRSAQAYLSGDSTAAFAAINTIPSSVSDARFYNYRTGLLLSVGRPEEAQADIDRSLALTPDNAHAIALQSVIALAGNDQAQALDLARRATARDPQSVPAWIALSYAQQAVFNLGQARVSVERAVRLDPKNSLPLARLSELWLGLGDSGRALKIAEQAAQQNPNSARTQSVFGFANLSQIKIAAAINAFNQAIALDSADPLPRLGLGLALIRRGQLASGRREIEVAALLDPNQSLTRSYLGKAYAEEGREHLVATQLEMAKQLDPHDPTPWFYDAIQKNNSNRPVEAVRDLQKSIDLNDERAVYRSRLLLDQDLATREINLAAIYQVLGLGDVANVEAGRSISLDPTNYSAHRFLSESYWGRPGYEIARASEQLQSQLLQPPGLYSDQPHTAETNLNVAPGVVLNDTGVKEDSQFAHPDTQFRISLVGGNDATFGDELMVSQLFQGTAYSLGQFHYGTDGFRAGSDIQHDIFTAFVQGQIGSGLDLQLELRNRHTEQGDLRQLLDPNFIPTDRRSLHEDVARLGLHWSASAQSDFIASTAFSDHRTELNRTESTATTLGASDAAGKDAQLQYLYRAAGLSAIAGLGWYAVENDSYLLMNLVFPPIVIPLLPPGTYHSEQHNAYLYTHFPLGAGLLATLGLSYDSIRSDQSGLDVNELNPKLGLQWQATRTLHLHAAAFDVTKRELFINQTLEPTQVAGFNQFFDDLSGTRARNYAIGIDADHKNNLYSGLEVHRRDLEVPSFAAGNVVTEKRDDDRYRAYLHWLFQDRWALNMDYDYQVLQGPFLSPDPMNLRTTSVPVGIRYFHPQGYFAGFVATYVNQSADYDPASGLSSVTERFSLLDLAMGYRWKRQRGALSLEVKNLFDRHFLFQDNSYVSADEFNFAPRFLPQRSVFLKAQLNF